MAKKRKTNPKPKRKDDILLGEDYPMVVLQRKQQETLERVFLELFSEEEKELHTIRVLRKTDNTQRGVSRFELLPAILLRDNHPHWERSAPPRIYLQDRLTDEGMTAKECGLRVYKPSAEYSYESFVVGFPYDDTPQLCPDPRLLAQIRRIENVCQFADRQSPQRQQYLPRGAVVSKKTKWRIGERLFSHRIQYRRIRNLWNVGGSSTFPQKEFLREGYFIASYRLLGGGGVLLVDEEGTLFKSNTTYHPNQPFGLKIKPADRESYAMALRKLTQRDDEEFGQPVA